MDESLRKIVDMDDDLRRRVLKAQADLEALRTQHKDADTALQAAQARVQQKANAILEQAQAQDNMVRQQEEKKYAAAEKRLQAVFDAHSEQWAKELAARCLEEDI